MLKFKLQERVSGNHQMVTFLYCVKSVQNGRHFADDMYVYNICYDELTSSNHTAHNQGKMYIQNI